jgi:hypothetical protein
MSGVKETPPRAPHFRHTASLGAAADRLPSIGRAS